jgi:hypothetical protein
MEFAAAPDPIRTALRAILGGLRVVLGMWLEPDIAVAMHRRIGQALGRVERMLVRFRAGRLWRRTPRAARGGAIRRAHCTLRLPRRFGWLVKAGGHRAASFGSQLQALLDTPEMARLLEAAPQAGRLLRPLCRALAVELPHAESLQKPEKARQRRGGVAARAHPARPEPFRIPLPRGVLSAARRQGYGKLC